LHALHLSTNLHAVQIVKTTHFQVQLWQQNLILVHCESQKPQITHNKSSQLTIIFNTQNYYVISSYWHLVICETYTAWISMLVLNMIYLAYKVLTSQPAICIMSSLYSPRHQLSPSLITHIFKNHKPLISHFHTVKLLINAPPAFIRSIGKYPRRLVEFQRARVAVVRVESNWVE